MGFKVLAIEVKDAYKAYEETIKRGAKSAMEPQVLTDEHGEIKIAAIHTYGENHS